MQNFEGSLTMSLTMSWRGEERRGEERRGEERRGEERRGEERRGEERRGEERLQTQPNATFRDTTATPQIH